MARSRKFLAAGAVGVAAVALIASTSVTGAYFTDSHPGSINASTGVVAVNVTPADLALNFTDLLPGEFKSQNVHYTAAGTGAVDIWLVLPTDGTAKYLNGVSADPATAWPLGRYGHFALDGPSGSFTSFNLAAAGTGSHAGATCYVNPTTGIGGSSIEASTPSETIDFCPVPSAILLSDNLTAGQGGDAKITFGYTKKLTGPQNTPAAGILAPAQVSPFKIVATQHGILPSNPFNPQP